MTPTREWDGLPENPEREGWHWLRRHSGGGPEAWLWTDCDGAEGEFQWLEEDGDGDPDTQSRWFEYLGPCLMPDEQRALLARAEAAEAELAVEQEARELASESDAGWEQIATAARAECERLRLGGCARGQTTTQWCAEAVQMMTERDAARAEAARLREALLRARLHSVQSQCWHALEASALARWIDDGMAGDLPAIRSPLVLQERAALATETRDE